MKAGEECAGMIDEQFVKAGDEKIHEFFSQIVLRSGDQRTQASDEETKLPEHHGFASTIEKGGIKF